ncbi:FliG C-terminal domain-containing protein [Bacillus solimangrovi]|uniref:Flagellar motor switch protein FliG C-terminal domain-containing protein n=1 Tax=Bacillus solimangrovi TaxID=1305675 RepID=A0A1E5LEQ9_9BACI|nr:FliG C-terminal domain-containing protein [Bacillus solimangrovi]OEH92557.1 hypothetical protein BFG57_15200 [Bacillus solimangrovi]
MGDKMLSREEIDALLMNKNGVEPNEVPDYHEVPEYIEEQLMSLATEKISTYTDSLLVVISNRLLSKIETENIESFQEWQLVLQIDVIRTMALILTGYEPTIKKVNELLSLKNTYTYSNVDWEKRLQLLIQFVSRLSDKVWEGIHKQGSELSTSSLWLYTYLQQERRTIESLHRIAPRDFQVLLRAFLQRYHLSALAILTKNCPHEIRQFVYHNLSSRLRQQLVQEEVIVKEHSENIYDSFKMKLIKLVISLEAKGDIIFLHAPFVNKKNRIE